MSFNHTFHWPAGPSDVVLTGTFDNWSGSLPLVKTSKGDFEITLPLKQEEDDKVLFKFIVDGVWTISGEYETIADGGNENNVIHLKNLARVEKKSSGSKIPEAGGLFATSGVSASVNNKENVAPTVEPSQEGKQSTLGEPGVAIPLNPHDIKEFNEVSNVDAKALNKQLNKEEEEKSLKTQVLPSEEGKQTTLTGEPGIAIPNNAQNIKEFNEVSDVDAKALNEKLNSKEGTTAGIASNETSSPTETSEKNTKKIAVKKLIRRNKKTGEEVVVSSEPMKDTSGDYELISASNGTKTLDPKSTDGAKEVQEAKEEVSDKPEKPATSAVTSSATPTATPTKPKAKAETPIKKEEAKKRSSIFKKFKKIFD